MYQWFGIILEFITGCERSSLEELICKTFTVAHVQCHKLQAEILGLSGPLPGKPETNHPTKQNNICPEMGLIAGGNFLCKLQTSAAHLRLM